MPKFDHRLKRLEDKTGIAGQNFDYWMVKGYDKNKRLIEKEIREIKAGNVAGKYRGSKFDPENPKHVIYIFGIPRPKEKFLNKREESPSKEISFSPGKEAADLSDQELDAEIASIQKELEK